MRRKEPAAPFARASIAQPRPLTALRIPRRTSLPSAAALFALGLAAIGCGGREIERDPHEAPARPIGKHAVVNHRPIEASSAEEPHAVVPSASSSVVHASPGGTDLPDVPIHAPAVLKKAVVPATPPTSTTRPPIFVPPAHDHPQLDGGIGFVRIQSAAGTARIV